MKKRKLSNKTGSDHISPELQKLLVPAKGQQPMTDERIGMNLDKDDDSCCDVCHEPLGDGCVCQNEYTREHDSRNER